MKFGVYDHEEKVWLFICETFSDAQRLLWEHDSKTAAVYPAPNGADTDIEAKPDGEPQFGSSPDVSAVPAGGKVVRVSGADPVPEPVYVPQEEVVVVSEANPAKPAAPPTPDKPVDPEVTADVRA